MHPTISKALQVATYVYGANWFKDPNFYAAKQLLRDRIKAPVFIHPQDEEMLVFIEGEMHRVQIDPRDGLKPGKSKPGRTAQESGRISRILSSLSNR